MSDKDLKNVIRILNAEAIDTAEELKKYKQRYSNLYNEYVRLDQQYNELVEYLKIYYPNVDIDQFCMVVDV